MDRPPHLYSPTSTEVIYHYTSLNAALSIVSNGNIWLSDFDKTNDSSEFVFARGIFLEQLKKCDGPIELKFLVAEAIGSINRYTKMMIGSFSTEMDDLPQWRTYADNGRGCVLGFSAAWMENYSGTSGRKIVYGEEAIRNFAEYSFDMLAAEYGKQKQFDAELRLLAQLVASDLFAFKHPKFQSEQEIRLSRVALRKAEMQNEFKACSGKTKDGRILKSLDVKVRDSVYGKTNFVELPYRSKFGDALTSIGLGPLASAEAERLVERSSQKLPNKPTIWKSSIPMR